jgi:hypothetical protein
MPGLFGIIPLRRPAQDEIAPLELLFDRMVERLLHQPRQRIDRWTDSHSGTFLGRVGLSTVNPTAWPMLWESSTGRDSLFVSGSVLQLPASRRSFDHAFFRELHGFHATVALKPQTATAYVAVDRRSSVPIYYAQVGNLLVFAPEVKALLAWEELRCDVDLGAMGIFLVCGYMLGRQTLFQSIRRLRAGELLRITDGSLTREWYWRYEPGSAVGKVNEDELREEVGRRVAASVARNLHDPAKTVTFLSGGCDSRAIVGATLDCVGGDGSRVNTVTWGASEGPPESDCSIAGRIASAFGLQHRFIQRHTRQYPEAFARVNYLVDALSDVPAFHPHEFSVMEELRDAGIERVFRGDQVFVPWGHRRRSPEGALAQVYIRRLRDAQGAADCIQPDWYSTLCGACDEVYDDARSEVEHVDPEERLDRVYYSHRLEGYLNTASYYKQFAVDQRNVLLDENILDLMPCIPARLRGDKHLFVKAMARNYPRLWQFPLATRDNLENWRQLLGTDGPVRSFAREQFNDRNSGIWEYLDRDGLLRVLNGLVPRKRSLVATLRHGVRSSVKRVFHAMPHGFISAVQERRTTNRAFEIRPDKLLLRALTLKYWHDTFVSPV